MNRIITLPGGGELKYKKKWKMNMIKLPRKRGDKDLFKKFLRLNDRKKWYYVNDFQKAGYHTTTLKSNSWVTKRNDIERWCNRNTPNWTSISHVYVFQTERDMMMFMLRWP